MKDFAIGYTLFKVMKWLNGLRRYVRQMIESTIYYILNQQERVFSRDSFVHTSVRLEVKGMMNVYLEQSLPRYIRGLFNCLILLFHARI